MCQSPEIKSPIAIPRLLRRAGEALFMPSSASSGWWKLAPNIYLTESVKFRSLSRPVSNSRCIFRSTMLWPVSYLIHIYVRVGLSSPRRPRHPQKIHRRAKNRKRTHSNNNGEKKRGNVMMRAMLSLLFQPRCLYPAQELGSSFNNKIAIELFLSFSPVS